MQCRHLLVDFIQKNHSSSVVVTEKYQSHLCLFWQHIEHISDTRTPEFHLCSFRGDFKIPPRAPVWRGAPSGWGLLGGKQELNGSLAHKHCQPPWERQCIVSILMCWSTSTWIKRHLSPLLSQNLNIIEQSLLRKTDNLDRHVAMSFPSNASTLCTRGEWVFPHCRGWNALALCFFRPREAQVELIPAQCYSNHCSQTQQSVLSQDIPACHRATCTQWKGFLIRSGEWDLPSSLSAGDSANAKFKYHQKWS